MALPLANDVGECKFLPPCYESDTCLRSIIASVPEHLFCLARIVIGVVVVTDLIEDGGSLEG